MPKVDGKGQPSLEGREWSDHSKGPMGGKIRLPFGADGMQQFPQEALQGGMCLKRSGVGRGPVLTE